MGNLKPSDAMGLPDGMHADGEYLWLRVKGASRSWIVRGPRVDGKKPEAGLGGAARVSLATARKERDKLLELWRSGKNPVEERRVEREARLNRKTFLEAGRLKIAAKKSGWRTSFEGRSETLDIWVRNIERDCAAIGPKFVDEIDINDIKRIVAPFWDQGKHRTARDMLKRMEMVFDYAIAHGWRSGVNPAAWAVFKHLWPGETASKTPHAALPWRDAPAFVSRLRASDAAAARVVEFAMLTATRSGETRGATWSEIDREARTWTVPGARMKKGRAHVVPLSDQALKLLDRVQAEGDEGDYLFPAYVNDGTRTQRAGFPIPNANVWRLVKRIAGGDATLHGFRSTFRDWCGDHAIERELAEHSLAHRFGSDVENAYARSRLVARRAPVMQAWADYLDGREASNVTPFRKVAS